MKDKRKTIDIKKKREAKMWKLYALTPYIAATLTHLGHVR